MHRKVFRTALAMALAWCLPGMVSAQTVDELVARNVAARGGAKAWRAVSALRLTGTMDVGQGMRVPYVLEQKRPAKMRLEFEFDGQTAVQCSDGTTGWKIAPFRGRPAPESMTEEEIREAASSADLYGLLFDYASRGHAVALLGREASNGRDTFKLKVTLPGGAVRWVYLDVENGLEVKVDAVRALGGREQVVETFYGDWQTTDGLLIPRRYETRTAGAEGAHLVTVDTVRVNPALDDARFVKPAASTAGGGNGR